jgi:excinuclease UvrABC nuclease subunit
VRKPSPQAISEALESALALPEPPRRIECFDISHTQGVETVASMVVWEDGRMRKSDYRKFIIRGDYGVREQSSRFVSANADHAPLAGGSSQAALPVAGDSSVDQPKAAASLPHSIGRANDDFAAMREVVTRRYQRLRDEHKPLPGLILIDGGLGQLHAAAAALDELQIINQPLAAIAKPQSSSRPLYPEPVEDKRRVAAIAKPHVPPAPALSSVEGSSSPRAAHSDAKGRHDSTVEARSAGTRHARHSASTAPRDVDAIFVLGHESAPIHLDRHSPILHLIQQIRDETHRFAVTFHRQRRGKAALHSALTDIPGIGPATARKLLRKFGSLAKIREASLDQLAQVVTQKQARAILAGFAST